MNKITKATIKSFVRKNAGRLYIMNLSDFDPMTDCVQQSEGSQFREAKQSDNTNTHTLGISGVWLVGQSRDYFQPFNKDGFNGIEVYNSCGNFVIAVKSDSSLVNSGSRGRENERNEEDAANICRVFRCR